MPATKVRAFDRPVDDTRGIAVSDDRDRRAAQQEPPRAPRKTNPTLRLDRRTPRTTTSASVAPRTTRDQYQTARLHLLGLIAQAEPATAIPSERTLSEQLSVSRGTVRTAIDDLVREGRLVRIQGSGTYLVDAKIDCPLRPQNSPVPRAGEAVSTTRILAVTRAAADCETAAALHIRPGRMVIAVERLREADNQPIALERSYLPYDRFPGLMDAAATGTPLHQLLSTRYKTKVRIGVETIETAPALDREARLLSMTPGVPLLVICRQTFDENNIPVEAARSAYRGDRCRFTTSPLAGW